MAETATMMPYGCRSSRTADSPFRPIRLGGILNPRPRCGQHRVLPTREVKIGTRLAACPKPEGRPASSGVQVLWRKPIKGRITRRTENSPQKFYFCFLQHSVRLHATLGDNDPPPQPDRQGVARARSRAYVGKLAQPKDFVNFRTRISTMRSMLVAPVFAPAIALISGAAAADPMV